MSEFVNQLLTAPVYLYAVFVCMGALAFVIAGAYNTRYWKRMRVYRAFEACALMLPLSFILSRLIFCAANIVRDPASIEIRSVLAVREGGLTIIGPFLAYFIVCSIRTRGRRITAGARMDLFVPGLMLCIAILRLGAGVTGQGVGKEIDAAFLRVFPFAVRDEYGAARHAVYRYEAIASLAIAVWAFLKIRKRAGAVDGETAFMAISFLSALQIVFDSLSDDVYMRAEYVRFHQLFFLLVLISFFIRYLRVLRRFRRARALRAFAALMFLAGAVVCVYQEFQVDTSATIEFGYAVMLAGALTMHAALWLMHNAYARRVKKIRARKFS